MTLRRYLIVMAIGSILCWLAWIFLLWSVDPTDSGGLSFAFFYTSLFLAVVGTFSVFGFVLRWLVLPTEAVVFRHVKQTFRQSILIGGMLVLLLWLRAHQLLAWWNVILLAGLFFFVEGIIFSNRKFTTTTYV